MIINGNTFAYGAFQLDTRPLYIECEFDETQQKYVPVQDYTLQQITEAAKTRPVFVKAAGYIVPLVYLASDSARFFLNMISDPANPTFGYSYVDAVRSGTKWNVEIKEV